MHAGIPTTRKFLLLALTALAPAGCTRDNPHVTAGQPPAPVAAAPTPGPSAPAPMTPTPMAPASGAIEPAPAAPSDAEGLSGTVVETMDSGGYTYAKLDRGTKQVWVAGPETKLTVGTVVGTVTGTLMPGFRSTTLNRTFDEIYFINSFPVTGSAPANPHAAAGGGAGTPMTEMIQKIEPAVGGQTIAQVFAGKTGLVGKPVAVRGKVVKLNNGILGHNWLHIQDGSGAAGTNDLTITTDAIVALGDVVVVRGTVAIDKDFGSGYKYDVLVENAAIAPK
jgi:hypothetical protein